MDHLVVLMVMLLLSSGVQPIGTHSSADPDVRVVGGASRCAGTVEVKNMGEWRAVHGIDWTLRQAAVFCKHLGCGSAISVGNSRVSERTPVWELIHDCVQSAFALRECATSSSSVDTLDLTCSESVRLMNGTSLCSGRLEVKSDQSNQSWSSVCEADFDQQDAEVVCRELGCGPPSVVQGGLYGEMGSPLWSKEFHCGGHESALMECKKSGSVTSSCSRNKVVGLICSEPVKMEGGPNRCAGNLKVKQGDWKKVDGFFLTLKETAIVCQYLDCGSALNIDITRSSDSSGCSIDFDCVKSGFSLKECAVSLESDPYFSLKLTCSDSVRLQNGANLCSGRLEVNNQFNQSWSSVCEADFDQLDAEVVCRELGCGSPSVLQGRGYVEEETTVWSKEFKCGGHEPALLDCRSTESGRTNCSSGKVVGLTCSDPVDVRLVDGASHCTGKLEVNHLGEWKPMYGSSWTLKETAVICDRLGCGSAVSAIEGEENFPRSWWSIDSECFMSGSALRECLKPRYNAYLMYLTCSDSVRLMNGTSLCSGRLEVKSDRSNQSWSSVCEADFDQQDAEVVCRELGCGPPLVLQGGLYGEVEAPMWSKEFQCGGHESALLDCRSSGSAGSSCSPGKAVGLTCSDPEYVRLVGGTSRCAGKLELKHLGVWGQTDIDGYDWTLKEAAVVCEHLDCGAAISVEQRNEFPISSKWKIIPDCFPSGHSLWECVEGSWHSHDTLFLSCLESVRLMNGTSLCSGRLEVKSDQSNPSWSSVCEADFDLQDAEVVCRELGCGPPSALQGGLYGEVEAPMWSKEFQCGGHESALLDCRRSGSARSSCSPGKAVGLTCSEPVRLVGGASHCAGKVEVKQAHWRPVYGYDWTLKEAAVVCEHLDCGSAVSVGQREESVERSVWWIKSNCVQSGSSLRECATSLSSFFILELTCSESVRLMNGTSLCSGRLEVKSDRSNQSWSSVCEADFDLQAAEVVCRELGCGSPSVVQGGLYGEEETPVWSKEFQCEGHESALLDCRSSGSARSSCSPGKAVGLTCSEPVRMVGGASRCADQTALSIRVVVLPLILLLENIVLYFYWKARRGRMLSRQETSGQIDSDLIVCASPEGQKETSTSV